MHDVLMVFPWFGAMISVSLGLICGSFLTFLFYRLKNNEPWLWGRAAQRSKCPHCGTILGARDLIPVLSWCINKGRCRHCNAPISIRYPLIEITSAVIFLLAYSAYLG